MGTVWSLLIVERYMFQEVSVNGGSTVLSTFTMSKSQLKVANILSQGIST